MLITSEVLTSTVLLAWWPSFLFQVTQFWPWPKNHPGKHFEQDAWWFLKHSDLYRVLKFFLDLPSDTVFDPKWPSFKLGLEITKTNIKSNIHDDYFKNVTSGVLTRLTWLGDLVFDKKWSSFEPDLEIIKTIFRARFMMITCTLKWWPIKC